MCTCINSSNTSLKFQIKTFKKGRSIAKCHFLNLSRTPDLPSYGIEFWQYLVMGGELGNETYIDVFLGSSTLSPPVFTLIGKDYIICCVEELGVCEISRISRRYRVGKKQLGIDFTRRTDHEPAHLSCIAQASKTCANGLRPIAQAKRNMCSSCNSYSSSRVR